MPLYEKADLKRDIEKAVDYFQARSKQLRVGRVTAEMFEGISIEYYGGMQPIKAVSTFTIEGPSALFIQPFDPAHIDSIVKAIEESNLPVTATNQGTRVKVSAPPMTQETRDSVVKELGKMCEESKVSVRQVRQEYMQQVKDAKGVSEDEQKWATNEVQKEIDAAIQRLDAIATQKATELRNI